MAHTLMEKIKERFESTNVTVRELEPIPLTPTILEECGKVEGRCFFIQDDFSRVEFLMWSDVIDGKYYFECGTYRIEVRYLHQLQNLYHSLTGKELNYQPLK